MKIGSGQTDDVNDGKFTLTFKRCSSLEAISLPADLECKFLQFNCFECDALSYFTPSPRCHNLDLGFYCCTGLSEVKWPPERKYNNVKLFFSDCKRVRIFELPAGCNISQDIFLIFDKCGIEEVVLPPDLKCKSIGLSLLRCGMESFKLTTTAKITLKIFSCASLKNLTLPADNNRIAGHESIIGWPGMPEGFKLPGGWRKDA